MCDTHTWFILLKDFLVPRGSHRRAQNRALFRLMEKGWTYAISLDSRVIRRDIRVDSPGLAGLNSNIYELSRGPSCFIDIPCNFATLILVRCTCVRWFCKMTFEKHIKSASVYHSLPLSDLLKIASTQRAQRLWVDFAATNIPATKRPWPLSRLVDALLARKLWIQAPDTKIFPTSRCMWKTFCEPQSDLKLWQLYLIRQPEPNSNCPKKNHETTNCIRTSEHRESLLDYWYGASSFGPIVLVKIFKCIPLVGVRRDNTLVPPPLWSCLTICAMFVFQPVATKALVLSVVCRQTNDWFM